jgi:hypothetical protein
MFNKHNYANVASTLALVVALGGTGYAAATLPAHSVGTRQLKDGAVTSKKVKNFSLSYKDFQGGQLGLVEGYAHINADGTVDEANSFGVTASNVALDMTNSGYCFVDLGFTLHGAVLTTERNEWGTSFALGPSDECPTGNQGQALTFSTTNTPGPSRSSIFIVFY